jgi:hypothetical protein
MNLILLFSILSNLSFSQVSFDPNTNAVFFYGDYSVPAYKIEYSTIEKIGYLGFFHDSNLYAVHIELFPKATELGFKAYKEKKLIYICYHLDYGNNFTRSIAFVVGKTQEEVQKTADRIKQYVAREEKVLDLELVDAQSSACINVKELELPRENEDGVELNIDVVITGQLISIGQFFTKQTPPKECKCECKCEKK